MAAQVHTTTKHHETSSCPPHAAKPNPPHRINTKNFFPLPVTNHNFFINIILNATQHIHSNILNSTRQIFLTLGFYVYFTREDYAAAYPMLVIGALSKTLLLRARAMSIWLICTPFVTINMRVIKPLLYLALTHNRSFNIKANLISDTPTQIKTFWM